MEFNKEEIELIKTALNAYYCQLKINCIYCESVFKKNSDECSAPSCPTDKCRKETKQLKEKIELKQKNDM